MVAEIYTWVIKGEIIWSRDLFITPEPRSFVFNKIMPVRFIYFFTQYNVYVCEIIYWELAGAKVLPHF